MKKELLIEIGVEELPAIPLLKIVGNIEKSWANILKSYGLVCDFEFFYTPRRLVLIHKDIPSKQEDSLIENFGAPIAMAFKDGEPTKATIGFAKKCGVEIEELSQSTKKGKDVLYYKQEIKGKDTELLLEDMIKEWIASMSFGKMMRWGDKQESFIRPIRWLQVRLGYHSVPLSLFGVKSSNYTQIHRMISYEPKLVSDISDYRDILDNGGVILEASKRKERIIAQFDKIEAEYNITIERDNALLNEIVAITEYPTALLGSFDEEFLNLPPEVIITSMKEHQRYFAVFNDDKLTNKFIVVSNSYCDDFTKIVEGNERVLKPRLADGMFFYKNDLERGLSLDGLEKIQFMDGLGSLRDKIEREEKIALSLFELYSSRFSDKESKKSIARAINLAKADLTSEMVYEFTELQGVMGYYYAKASGEEESVYNAIKEQYMPLGDGAELPSSLFSAIISISIKLDTLMGLFSIGKLPTGSKDPYALRRAVNGIIRMVIEYDIAFDIDTIIDSFANNYQEFDKDKLKEFIIERINKLIKANPSLLIAVLASGERDINKIFKKVDALNSIVASSEFESQFSTFKRVANISKDIDLNSELKVDTTLFNEDETKLYNEFIKISTKKYNNYKEHLEALFTLKPYLDNYFDEVMVNVEDKAIANNRLNTIASIYKSFREIADIKEISI
ncbi:Glycyl-tRNA synthetase beta chain [hydrothermal vent metagenome]|uniref:glycine--tRNA ligase n=1 Tax=hydrothermal vent metagenome TaxID=652676 RepID=A0A1W1ELD0_9ZZZZ